MASSESDTESIYTEQLLTVRIDVEGQLEINNKLLTALCNEELLTLGNVKELEMMKETQSEVSAAEKLLDLICQRKKRTEFIEVLQRKEVGQMHVAKIFNVVEDWKVNTGSSMAGLYDISKIKDKFVLKDCAEEMYPLPRVKVVLFNYKSINKKFENDFNDFFEFKMFLQQCFEGTYFTNIKEPAISKSTDGDMLIYVIYGEGRGTKLKGGVDDVDGVDVFDDIINKFTDDNCPGLKSKPKIFIINIHPEEGCDDRDIKDPMEGKTLPSDDMIIIWGKQLPELFADGHCYVFRYFMKTVYSNYSSTDFASTFNNRNWDKIAYIKKSPKLKKIYLSNNTGYDV